MAKYIFVTGGVVSSLGKGITAASIGRLLINRGLRVNIQKLDPYLNVDTGNMDPFRHGEVFVTDDGKETDLDLGHYERFLGRHLTKESSFTMGKVYSSVLAKERNGEYGGSDVQVVPHVTDEIKSMLRTVQHDADIVIVELGGTVGDLESLTAIEAIRQLRKDLGPKGSISIHVTLVPYLTSSHEIKTKPTQSSVRDLNHMGIYPDIVVCRTDAGVVLGDDAKEKIAMFCNLESVKDVIHNPNCESIYQVPILLKEQKVDDILLKKLGLKARPDNLGIWKDMVKRMLYKNGRQRKVVAIVGRYSSVPDAYISVTEAIKAAALHADKHIEIKLANKVSQGIDAIVAPGGCEHASKFSQEFNIPYLATGVYCKETARHIPGLKNVDHELCKAKERFRFLDENLPVINEFGNHKFHITTQFYPELLSKPYDAHPLFIGLLEKM